MSQARQDESPSRKERPRGRLHGQSRMLKESHYKDCPRVQWATIYMGPCNCGDIFPPLAS